MGSKYFHLLSCIFLISVLNNPFIVFSHQHATQKPSPPLKNFLQNLVGARKGNSAKGLSHLKKYLSRLGHMSNYNNTNPTNYENDLFDENLEKAVKNYQTFFQLTVHGVLDDETVNQLNQPRCGVPDNGMRPEGKISIGASHYTFFPNAQKWPPGKRDLTYSFPPGERTDVNVSTLDATDMWAGVSNFRFSYTKDYNRADIKIAFLGGDHGDGNPFDGPRGVLAHAFGPPDGRLHYDKDEAWVYDTIKDEFDLLTVGLHELGHVLGLGHSSDKNAIMWPYIASGERKGLGNDDKAGIRALYS